MSNETDERRTAGARIGVHFKSRILSGVLVLVPLVVTAFVIHLVFASLTVFLDPIFKRVLPDTFPAIASKALSALATLLIVYAVGAVATMVFGRRLLRLVEALLQRMPVVGSVYAAAKQIVEAVRSGGGKSSFKAVVRVSFPNDQCRSLGFVTGSHRRPDGVLEYRVFMPTSPNPTSGYLLLLTEAQVEFTQMPVEDAVKTVVSGGVLYTEGPDARVTAAPAGLEDGRT